MPAPTRKALKAEQHIENAIEELPFYVVEFVRSKIRARLSPGTISGYLYDIIRFLNWLRSEGFTDAKSNKEIPYTVLEVLTKKEAEYFLEMLMNERIEKQKDVFVKRSEASVNRFIQSLKSLFNYLTAESENDVGDCYFDRNVFAKIKTPRKTESTARRAKRISSTTLNKDEMEGLLEFIKYGYEKTATANQLVRYKRDRLRDIAIISLLQGSGVRVQEAAGLLLTDIDNKSIDITALRKGNSLDTVSILPSAMEDLMAYISQRETMYKPESKNIYVFLTRYRGAANPISVDAIQNIVFKYTSAYLSGRGLSPHKLRHSFAVHWLQEGGSLVSLRDQLGHSTIETTVLYTNFSQDEQRATLSKMDQSRKDDDDIK